MIHNQVQLLGPFDNYIIYKKVDTRARARAVSLKIQNTGTTSQSWKLGTFRLDTTTRRKKIMAKIVQVITRPEQEYNLQVAEAQVRDLDAIVEKLNSTFQEELKDEIEAFNFFIN